MSLCLGEEAFMESSQDPMTAAPRSTCAASFRHDSPPFLGGGNEKCRAAAAAATTASSGPSTTPCFVMVSGDGYSANRPPPVDRRQQRWLLARERGVDRKRGRGREALEADSSC
jgi:hypothetical protein